MTQRVAGVLRILDFSPHTSCATVVNTVDRHMEGIGVRGIPDAHLGKFSATWL
jgi:hypothetical protein